MRYLTLTDAVQHARAQGLRARLGSSLLALEAKHVPEGERCWDESLLAQTVLDAATHGDLETLAQLGIAAPASADDAALEAAILAAVELPEPTPNRAKRGR